MVQYIFTRDHSKYLFIDSPLQLRELLLPGFFRIHPYMANGKKDVWVVI